MQILTDARGHEHAFDRPPARIVSLAPSLTATILDLGQRRRLVGCTDYCQLPGAVRLPRLGGTKNPKRFDVLRLRPDLVLVNMEENRLVDSQWFEQKGLQVFVTFPASPSEALATFRTLALLLGCAADPVVTGRLDRVSALLDRLLQRKQDRTVSCRFFAPVWKSPWITANADTYLSALLELGGVNCFAERQRRFPLAFDLGLSVEESLPDGRDTRYPRLNLDELLEAGPDVIFLPSEPYPFGAQDRDELLCEAVLATLPAIHFGRVHLVDGKLLTWHSPAWLEAALVELLGGQLAAWFDPTSPTSRANPTTS